MASGTVIQVLLQQEPGEVSGNFHLEKKLAAGDRLQLRLAITELFPMPGEV